MEKAKKQTKSKNNTLFLGLGDHGSDLPLEYR